MPATTTNHAIPYPLGTDPPSVATDMQAMAQKLDTEVPLPNVPNGYVRLDGSSNIALAAAQRIIWAGDTNLYRSGANQLKTDNQFYVGSQFSVSGGIVSTTGPYYVAASGTAQQTVIGDVSLWTPGSVHAGGVTFGSSVFYQSASGIMTLTGILLTVGGYQATQLANVGYSAFVAQVAGDAYARFFVGADGKINWGSGAASADTYLARIGVNYLSTGGAIQALQGFNANAMSGPGQSAFQAAVSGDTADRFFIRGDGYHAWGPGNAAVDTSLYRSYTNQLFTPGLFLSQGGFNAYQMAAAGNYAFTVAVTGDTQQRFILTASGGMYWGPGGSTGWDTNLTRSGVNSLYTQGVLQVGSNIYGSAPVVANYNIASQVGMGYNYGTGLAAAAISFGSPYDTNLYRTSAGNLQTDGGFYAKGNIGSYQTVSNILTGVGFDVGGASSPWTYTSLWYDTVNNIAKVGSLSGGVAWRNVFVGWGNSTLTNTIYFCTNNAIGFDTNLYRLSAGILKSDGYFVSAVGFETQRAAGGEAFGARLNADTNLRFQIDTNGLISWGPGNAAADVNLQRISSGLIGTNSFWVGTNQYFGSDTGTIFFGSASDCSISRWGVKVIQVSALLMAPGVYGSNTSGPVGISAGAYTGYGSVGLYGNTDNAANAWITHNAYFQSTAGAGNMLWNATHSSFGSRAILFGFTTGITFYADANPATAGATVTPTRRFNIGNGGNIVIDPDLLNTATLCFGGDGLTYLNRSANNLNLGPSASLNIAHNVANQTALQIQNLASNGYYLAFKRGSDSTNVFIMSNDGRMVWSAGGGSAQDTNLYRGGAGILMTDGLFSVGSIKSLAYGTSFPASPGDGQEFTLVDSLTAPNYIWRFRYNAGSTWAQKWEFIGGSPFLLRMNDGPGVSGWVGLTPTWAAIRAGVYNVISTCRFVSPSAAGLFGVAIAVNGALSGYQQHSQSAGGNCWISITQEDQIVPAAGNTVGMLGYSGNGDGQASSRSMMITPLRLQ